MKRKQRFAFVTVALALAFAFVIGYSHTHAQGQFPGYKSTIQTYNMSQSTANIILAFYRQDGSLEKTLTDIIERDRSKIYFTLPVQEGFSGSVVISSDQPVAALSNMMNSALTAGGTYVGESQGSTTVYLPLLMANSDGGFNSWFALQNPNPSSTNVTVNYSDGITTNITLAAYASHNFYQKQEPHTSNLFSAKVTSAEPVVVVAFLEDTASMAAYNGFASGAVNPAIPLVNANNNGINTDIQIQNTGDTDTSVTVSYMPSAAGSACTETQMVAAGQTVTFAGGAFESGANSTCSGGEKFIGSGHVTTNSASQPLAAVVSQRAGSSPLTQFAAYGSFDPDDATSAVRMPTINDRNAGFFTSINVMNVGSSETAVACSFTDTTYTVTGTLQPNETLTDLQANKIQDGYVGSATCRATADGAKIIAVVNQLKTGATDDQFQVYEAINQ
ncbi:MAG: hypothetical protein OXG26_19985 [Caldilineaceae bacterium]|nr:hypothetical protein [Caldilineaceae bacterium]